MFIIFEFGIVRINYVSTLNIELYSIFENLLYSKFEYLTVQIFYVHYI